MQTRSKALIAIVLTALTVSACANTVRGVGADVKSTGRAVQDVAR
jgi:predicted small secreted protein